MFRLHLTTRPVRPGPSFTRVGLRAGVLAVLAALTSPGCTRQVIRDSDRDVYRLLQERQRTAIGATSDVNIGPESGDSSPNERMYSFTPRPVDSEVPDSFQSASNAAQEIPPPDNASQTGAGSSASAPPSNNRPPTTSESQTQEENAGDLNESIFRAADLPNVKTFGLKESLAYANRRGRRLQDSKETLYQAALDLTLERHLWTPRFVASVQSLYDDLEPDAEQDQTLTTIADLAVTQNLPFGGNITARVVDTLVRDVNRHATDGESGQLILEANILLLRGAGPSAYETRYTAERELIYAVRTYEHFRRSFLVEVASDYFNLQLLKAAIRNTYKSYLSRKAAFEKAEFMERMGRSRTIFETPRAKSILRQAEASLVSAKELYASALDRFKISLGMKVQELLDVVDQDDDAESLSIEWLLPAVDLETAVAVAHKYRLDLLNSADGVDDARRGITVAQNRILPDLGLSGNVIANTHPEHRNTAATFSTDRTTWQTGLTMRLDDRMAERNAYRSSLIALRRATRDHEQFLDTVEADARRALRRVGQQADLRKIQELNVKENELRLEAAQAQFDLGKSTNQDVVDAETDLLDARNNYARAVSNHRVVILEFRRDTGTLRVQDNGAWQPPNP